MISKTILGAIKPFQLMCLLATYVLGGGLVQYVKQMRDWAGFIQGGLLLVLITLSLDLILLLHTLTDQRRWPAELTLRMVKTIRLLSALTAATLLTVSMTIIIHWMVSGLLWQGVGLLIAAFFITGVLLYYSSIVKSLQFLKIFLNAIYFVILPPALSYFLQSQDMHRLLTMVVIGLVPAYLAYCLLIQLKTYGGDQSDEKITVVTQIGWQGAMTLHNALILFSYLLLALNALLGFPWFLIWPVFLTIPIGLVEIWLVERVRRGAKPLWRVMQFASASVFLIPIYLLGFAFWIR